MTLLRRHLWAIIVYLAGVVLLGLASLVLVLFYPSQLLLRAILGFSMPVISLVPLVVVLPLFYRRADNERKVEWSVLAPALMAGLVLGSDLNSVRLLVDWLPFDVAPASYIIQCLFDLVFAIGVAILCIMLVARYMSKPQAGCPRAGHWRLIVSVLVMAFVVALIATTARALVDALHWGHLRLVLIDGTSLPAISLIWLGIAHWVWRRTDKLSCWSATAAIAAWVALAEWLLMFRTGFRRFDFDFASTFIASIPFASEEVDQFFRMFLGNFFWGALAGVLAILYARFVTYRIGLRKWDPGYSATSAQE